MRPESSRPGAPGDDAVPAVEEPREPQAPDAGADPSQTPGEWAESADQPTPVPPASDGGDADVKGDADVDYRDRWLRTEAELQNFRRRAQRDVEESSRAAEERVLRDLIEVLDDLELGLDTARKAGADAAWIQGMELVANRARDLLARYGVTAMDPLGKPFDPRVHEAMFELEAVEHEPGTVVQVVRRGFVRNGRPLRPARVGVARGMA